MGETMALRDTDHVPEDHGAPRPLRGLPQREIVDVPEWVSELRRLYVEPKGRTGREHGRGKAAKASRRSEPVRPERHPSLEELTHRDETAAPPASGWMGLAPADVTPAPPVPAPSDDHAGPGTARHPAGAYLDEPGDLDGLEQLEDPDEVVVWPVRHDEQRPRATHDDVWARLMRDDRSVEPIDEGTAAGAVLSFVEDDVPAAALTDHLASEVIRRRSDVKRELKAKGGRGPRGRGASAHDHPRPSAPEPGSRAAARMAQSGRSRSRRTVALGALLVAVLLAVVVTWIVTRQGQPVSASGGASALAHVVGVDAAPGRSVSVVPPGAA